MLPQTIGTKRPAMRQARWYLNRSVPTMRYNLSTLLLVCAASETPATQTSSRIDGLYRMVVTLLFGYRFA